MRKRNECGFEGNPVGERNPFLSEDRIQIASVFMEPLRQNGQPVIECVRRTERMTCGKELARCARRLISGNRTFANGREWNKTAI